ncbi:MAG: hypothetical protein AAGI68_09125 [Planctomycetota bacterium]
MSMFGIGGDGGFDAAAHQAASAARSEARSAATNLRDMEQRLDRLLLVNVALWSLLQEKTGLTERDLMDRVRLLDEMDGRADGKASGPKVSPCHACGRPVPARRDKCPYCGAVKRRGSAFDAV